MRTLAALLLAACAITPPADDTDDTDLPCGPQWSASCTIVDGQCFDPTPHRLGVPPLDDERAEAITRAASQSTDCYPQVLARCEATRAWVHAYFGGETASVGVFNSSTGVWEAGLFLTDAPGEGVCGNNVWLGEVAHKACADKALAAVYAMASADCEPFDTETTCAPEDCFSDAP